MKSVTIEELAEKLENNVSLIDVREKFEYAMGHVPSALNIPLSELEQRFKEIPVGSYIICQSGARSLRACEFLEENDIDVINVIAGTLAWQEDLVEGENNA